VNISELLGRGGHTFLVDTPSNDMVLPDCKVGVEVELENIHGFGHQSQSEGMYWEIIKDGSLRNYGMEFVSLPVFGVDIQLALDDLKNTLAEQKPSLHPRTSLHVHMDVEDMTAHSLANLLVLEVVFERLLYNYCDMERYNNIFCNPSRKCKNSLRQLGALMRIKIDDKGEFYEVLQQSMKYTGLNIKSVLPQYNNNTDKEDPGGHIEFRMHQGTDDIVRIKEWINILMCLKKYAVEFSHSPEELILYLSIMGIDNIIDDVFGEYASLVKYPEQLPDIYAGISAVQYSIKNYTPLGTAAVANSLFIPKHGVNKYLYKYNEVHDIEQPKHDPEEAEMWGDPAKAWEPGEFVNLGGGQIHQADLAAHEAILAQLHDAGIQMDPVAPIFEDDDEIEPDF